MVSSFVDRDMVMRYHWGLGVGHTYVHGIDNEVPQNETSNGDNRGQAANSRNGITCYTFPDVSDDEESGEDDLAHSVGDVESDSGGSDSESVGSVDDDVEDYDTLDYQN